ncbi:serine/threonine-protein phosphatase 6 regulatory ankyrin repeat subunit C isoform X1 [Halyomorpha halys]|uniref:serine/threonine-protein phosphatase 6 regulatory ankyrin repeat subunit C isoform X1 n=1 Tax=Halyomorpha halys TaxID=286706 RepID=UPI0006D4F4BA|nr:serine/threonine-protein phosphatase 6 regulatory ankyrin repeat subunit B-like [Halyomorpha halys]XP_014286300.1 serine/threonine-protein phosphatase 6 regulatory ankyrin repeat subunit B-like [Halyomorpha halys]XP_014286301.1 serine/threonine-protein phosphatase 6 regulatory ankyrin repeat subunit B-like [Halyomorpha halys]XP_014286302.1 serine/threonine-protein phosphatase 6 regulatory ankyrin repeat subunit B-like [Halyomorpha halys]
MDCPELDPLLDRKCAEESRSSQDLQNPSPSTTPRRKISRSLRTALYRNTLDDFWALVKAGVDINARDRGGRTPLHMVINWKKDLSTIKAVLSAGADPNASDSHGLTPLHSAVISNSSSGIIKALLSAGAEIDIPDSRGKSPLMHCLKKNNISVIRTLLSAGANVKVPDLMVEAIQEKAEHEVLKLFLMAGASVNDSSFVFPPIMYAVFNDDPIVVKMLLIAGAQVDFIHPRCGSTLLHQTSVVEIAQDLIKYGLCVNAMNFQGETPLHRAVIGDHFDLAVTLIKAGADVHSVVREEGNNCLHLAKSASMIRVLASRGVDINAQNQRGELPIHSLVIRWGLLLSPLMHFRGVDLRYFKDTNCTMMNEYFLALKEMVKYGADINTYDTLGVTVLEYVVSNGHSKMVSFLIKRGAELNWRRLFFLGVFNICAVQLLIKESLIGNVIVPGRPLFFCTPDEDPYLRAVKSLLTYANRCVAELELMRRKKINCNNSVYYFVVEIAPYTKALRLCPHHKVTDEEYSAMFPIYRNHVAARLNQCYKRAFLLDVLEAMDIHAPKLLGKGTVSLVSDCKFAVAQYLSNNNLFNFLVAMGLHDFSFIPQNIPSCDKSVE